MTIQISGIAHIQLTVRNFEVCLPFYKKLLSFFEMTPMFDGHGYYYCVGGKTGIAICRASDEFKEDSFHQGRPGLHHFCIKLRSREDVDTLYQFVKDLGAKIIREPRDNSDWAPGYYSILFEDPEGIRIEANYVPGKGNLDPKVSLPKKWDITF